MATSTTNYEFIKPENDNLDWGDAVRSNFQKAEDVLVGIQAGSGTTTTNLQFHKTSGTEHDPFYYTESELDGGQLNGRYYTKVELTSGQLDGRYYTKAQLYNKSESYSKSTAANTFMTQDGAVSALADRYYRKTEISTPLGNRYYSKALVLGLTSGTLHRSEMQSYAEVLDDLDATQEQILQDSAKLFIKPLIPRLNVPYEIRHEVSLFLPLDKLGTDTLMFAQRIPSLTTGVSEGQLQVNLRNWYSNLINNGKVGTKAPGDILYITVPASRNSYGMSNQSDTESRRVYKSV